MIETMQASGRQILLAPSLERRLRYLVSGNLATFVQIPFLQCSSLINMLLSRGCNKHQDLFVPIYLGVVSALHTAEIYKLRDG